MLRKQREARRTWYELDDPPRRALQLRLPSDFKMMKWRDGVTVERVPEIIEHCVIDWRGFTEADLLGASLAGDAMQPFDKEVFDEWGQDHFAVLSAVTVRVFEFFQGYYEARMEAEKKPSPS